MTHPFTTAAQVKAHIATLPPSEARIEPHYSASYIWNVWHPPSFGRGSYGFSSEESLLAWAQIQADPRVQSVSDESDSGDGYWVYLRKPYVNKPCQTTALHAFTIRECCDVLNNEVVEDPNMWDHG